MEVVVSVRAEGEDACDQLVRFGDGFWRRDARKEPVSECCKATVEDDSKFQGLCFTR